MELKVEIFEISFYMIKIVSFSWTVSLGISKLYKLRQHDWSTALAYGLDGQPRQFGEHGQPQQFYGASV